MKLMSRVDGKVSPEAAANINMWLTEPKYAMYADAVRQMILDEQWKELEDAFFKVESLVPVVGVVQPELAQTVSTR